MTNEQMVKFWWRHIPLDPDLYRDTGKTCLGEGIHCPVLVVLNDFFSSKSIKHFGDVCIGYNMHGLQLNDYATVTSHNQL